MGHGDAAAPDILGGNRNAVETLCQLFEQKCLAILADNKLYFEESILTGLLADHPELFTTFTFDSWYHEGWSYYNPNEGNCPGLPAIALGDPKLLIGLPNGARECPQFGDSFGDTVPPIALGCPWIW